MKLDTAQEILETPAQRLKYIRALLRLTRAYLHKHYGLPEVTLKSWENGTAKLTPTGAQRCVEIYRNEGLILSEDWILEGVGLDPKSTITVSDYFSTPSNTIISVEDDEVAMLRDANAFKESHSNAVVMLVPNDAMLPLFSPGDYVGGKLRTGRAITDAIDKVCIVYLKSGEKLVRRVLQQGVHYNLTTLNPMARGVEPILANVEIESVAPIIWHRWKDA